MYRTLEETYIESLRWFPTIPPAVYQKMLNSKFLHHYPDFEHKTKICLSRHEKQSLTIDDCEDYLSDAAIKFSRDQRDEIRQFFWNIDFENIFCLTSSDISAISLMEPNPQILRLLYSQKVSVKKTSKNYASMAIFLMNRFTQHFQNYQSKTKTSIISMITRRLRTKIVFAKLPLIGQQYLSKQSLQVFRGEIEPHYINFMPFLQAICENKIDIMMLDDLKWFSRIIEKQNFPVSLSGSEPEQDGLHPVLAQLIKYIKSILFSKSNEICFKICIFYVIVYTKRLLLKEKNRLTEPIFLQFIFNDSPEIHDIFSFLYIDEAKKYPLTMESMKKTNPERYRNIEIYEKRFSFIVEQFENIYNGILDLPISQLFGQTKGATPFQQIVSYILDIYLIYKFYILNEVMYIKVIYGLLFRILFDRIFYTLVFPRGNTSYNILCEGGSLEGTPLHF